MFLKIVLSTLMFYATTARASGSTPACLINTSRTVQCEITYVQNGYDADRSLTVSEITFKQNPASLKVCDTNQRAIFNGRLEGDAQQQVALNASGFAGDILENLETGLFHLTNLHYTENIPPTYRIVSNFPTLDLSFREDREQDISFRNYGREVQAHMKCRGSEITGN